jgi:hypothetical protein
MLVEFARFNQLPHGFGFQAAFPSELRLRYGCARLPSPFMTVPEPRLSHNLAPLGGPARMLALNLVLVTLVPAGSPSVGSISAHHPQLTLSSSASWTTTPKSGFGLDANGDFRPYADVARIAI